MVRRCFHNFAPVRAVAKIYTLSHTQSCFLLLNVQDQKIYNKKQYKEKAQKLKLIAKFKSV